MAFTGIAIGILFVIIGQYVKPQPYFEETTNYVIATIVKMGTPLVIAYLTIFSTTLLFITIKWYKYVRDFAVIYFFFSIWLFIFNTSVLNTLLSKRLILNGSKQIYINIFVYAVFIIIFSIIILLLRLIGQAVKFIVETFKANNKDGKFSYGKFFKEIKNAWAKLFYFSKDQTDTVDRLSDQPLNNIDQIDKIKDSVKNPSLFINFVSTYKDLEKIITSDCYSRSICLDAPWGSGKTSLIKILQSHLNTRKDYSEMIWLDFDSWDFGNSTELIRELFDSLNKMLKEKYYTDLQPELSPYVKLVTPVIESLDLTGKFNTSISKLPFLTRKNLTDLKESICRKVSDVPTRILIVIDDIDRLEYEEVMTALRVVRMLSNVQNILFVLPFDYKRVGDLIVKEKGDGYKDFLGKIINNRLSLNPYNYDELESVFISSIKDSRNDQETETLKNVFVTYVEERNHSRFEDVRKREGEYVGPEESLSPAYVFINDVFRIFYSEYLLKDKYNVLKNGVKNLLNFFVNMLPSKSDGLELAIFENLSLVRKLELADKFANYESQIDIDMKTLSGANVDEIAAVKSLWITFINSLRSGYKHTVIEDNLNKIIEFQVLSTTPAVKTYTLPNVKNTLDQIGLELSKYKTAFDDNQNYHLEIRNWLAQDITPRHIKELARAEVQYSNSIIEKKVEEKNIAIKLARLQ